MKLFTIFFFVLNTFLCGMWLTFAVMGAWANYVLNSYQPTAFFMLVNSGVLLLMIYSISKLIKMLAE